MTLHMSGILLLSIILILSFVATGLIRQYFWPRTAPRKSTSKELTFRIRGIHQDWDVKRLTSFLVDHFDSVPTVTSLAGEIQGGVQTATVFFKATPNTRRIPVSGKSILLPESPNEEASRNAYLEPDTDFHGITTLFIPPEDDHLVEYVSEN